MGGSESTHGHFPWQVSLEYNGKHTCGGALIDSNHVLTAAHCVDTLRDKRNKLKVTLGDHNKREVKDAEQTLRLSSVTTHKNWNMTAMQDDIAILKLSESVTLSSYISPICLPYGGMKPDVGTECMLSGWGKTSARSNTAPVLQETKAFIVSNEKCGEGWKDKTRIPITDDMICSSGHSSDASLSTSGGCQGDSGGPLSCKVGNTWKLFGIVSWGHMYCETNFYTVYTRVTSYLHWIQPKTG